MIAIVVAPVAAEATRWLDLGGFVIRLTLVASSGWLLLALMPRAAAARRHLVAVATLVAMLALPIATALLPAWRLPLLPARATALLDGGPGSGWDARSSRGPFRYASATRSFAPGGPALPHSSRASRPDPGRAMRGTPMSGSEERAMLASPVPAELGFVEPAAPMRSGVEWPAALVIVALGITLLLLLRVVAGMVRAGRVARGAAAVVDPVLISELEAARVRMGVGGRIRLAVSEEVRVPVVLGLWRPTLLLPAAAPGWTIERLRLVFLHELAHVRRGDGRSLLIGRLASACFWYLPLTWMIEREARRESERACDDRVLASGERASRYAETLFAIARLAARRDRLAAATLAVAGPSSLELRLRAILSAETRRGPAGRGAVIAAVVTAALVLVPLVTVRVVAAPRPVAARAAKPVTSACTVTTSGGATITTTCTSTATHTACSSSTPTGCRTSTGTECRTSCDGQGSSASASASASSSSGMAWADARSAAKGWVDAVFAGSKSGDGLYDEARSLYEAKQYDQAAETYRRAALAGYRPATAFYNAACSYALDGQSDLALSALAEARDAGFDDVRLLTGDSDLASLRSDRRFGLIVRAVRYTDRAQNERQAAAREFAQLESSGSNDASQWRSTGMTLMRSGDAEHAAEAFGRQYAIDRSPSALYNQACAWALGGEKPRALKSLEQAIEAGFGDADHIVEDADLASLHDDPGFQPLVRLTRDLTLYGEGIDDDDRDTWRAALPRFEKAAREHADIGRAWFNLGFARLRIGDVPGSREGFTRALELKHRPATSMYNLACVEAQGGNADQAMSWLDKAQDAGMDLGNIFNDKDLDPLHADPRFRALEDQVRGRMAEKKHAEKKQATR